MKISNQNKSSFGSKFIIRELPVGDKVLSCGGFTHIRDYITRPLPEFESTVNNKVNQSLVKLLEKIKKQFGHTAHIDRDERHNLDLLITEHVLKVDDSLDSVIKTKLTEFNQKKKTHFWQKKYNPQIDYVIYENPKKKESFVEQVYAKHGSGLL